MKVLNNNNLGITYVMLNQLKQLFPDTLPASPITGEDLRYLQGQQSVIRKLEELQNEFYEE